MRTFQLRAFHHFLVSSNTCLEWTTSHKLTTQQMFFGKRQSILFSPNSTTLQLSAWVSSQNDLNFCQSPYIGILAVYVVLVYPHKTFFCSLVTTIHSELNKTLHEPLLSYNFPSTFSHTSVHQKLNKIDQFHATNKEHDMILLLSMYA